MNYDILKKNKLVNTIIADDENWVEKYCKDMGFTYRLSEFQPISPESEKSNDDIILKALVDMDYRLCLQELRISQNNS